MGKEVLEMEVKSNIKSVTKETDELGKSLGKASDETKGLGTGLATTGTVGSRGFKMISSAVYGLGVALKALGIGLIVALFVSLKEALERNQKVMNTVNTIFSAVSITLNQVANTLTDVVKWVTESSNRFDGLGKVMGGITTIILTPFKAAFLQIKLAILGVQLAWANSPFGGKGKDLAKIAELRVSIAETGSALVQVGSDALNAGKDIITNFGDAVGEIGTMGKMAIDGISEISIKSNIELAKATTAAKNSSALAEVAIQGLIEKYDRQAELQRQIRDDETKTFAERIEANKKLGEILDEQETEMLALADTRVASAKLELDANKENVELQVAYQQALNDRAGVEAQVAGFRSEQMTNEVSLNKELLESQKEIRAEGLIGMELELQELQDAYDLKIKMAEKAGMKTTAITKKFEAAKTKIVQDNENEKLAAITGFVSAVNALAGKQKGIAVATALMNTYLGVTEVMKDPMIPSTTMKFLAAGTVLANGLANVQNILKQDVGGSGGGGGSVGATPQTPAPEMLSGAFTLGGGVKPEPARAYVVSDDITNNQNKLAIIRRRATI